LNEYQTCITSRIALKKMHTLNIKQLLRRVCSFRLLGVGGDAIQDFGLFFCG